MTRTRRNLLIGIALAAFVGALVQGANVPTTVASVSHEVGRLLASMEEDGTIVLHADLDDVVGVTIQGLGERLAAGTRMASVVLVAIGVVLLVVAVKPRADRRRGRMSRERRTTLFVVGAASVGWWLFYGLLVGAVVDSAGVGVSMRYHQAARADGLVEEHEDLPTEQAGFHRLFWLVTREARGAFPWWATTAPLAIGVLVLTLAFWSEEGEPDGAPQPDDTRAPTT